MAFERLALAAATAIICANASAADVAVFQPQAVSLTHEQAEAIGTVLAQAYARASGADVMTPRQAASAVTNPNDLPAAAARLGVHEYIEVSAVGLIASNGDSDSRIIIQAVRRTRGGDVICRTESTAMSMGDVEVVAARLARALYEKSSVEATRDLHTVTQKEASGENRTFMEKVMGVKVAVVWPVARDASFEPLVVSGFDGRLEGRRYFLEFGSGFGLPGGSSSSSKQLGLLYGEIGGSLYLTDTSVSPYVGLGISPRIFVNTGGGVNLAGYAQVGVMFMRESSTRLYAEARVAQNALPVRLYLDDYRATGRDVYPTEIGAAVGIGW